MTTAILTLVAYTILFVAASWIGGAEAKRARDNPVTPDPFEVDFFRSPFLLLTITFSFLIWGCFFVFYCGPGLILRAARGVPESSAGIGFIWWNIHHPFASLAAIFIPAILVAWLCFVIGLKNRRVAHP